ncbi:MAG: hypothetical protein U5J97_00475 [Trueperaceae bacterium]|nr:hypothetical protein [Trueperaceae bacterium]
MSDTVRYLHDGLAPSFLPPVEERVRLCGEALAALVDRASPGGPGRSDLPPKVPVVVGHGEAFAHAMPAAVQIDGRRLVGMKWISGDPHRPPPTIGGLIVLEDPGMGGLRGLVSAAGLTGARTAAVSLAALRLVPARTERTAAGEAPHVVFVGGGVQAFSHREALAALLPAATVRFVTRRDEAQLPLHDGDDVVRPERLAASLPDADVVITSAAFGTVGRELGPDRLSPGATVIATDYATAVTARTLQGIREQGIREQGIREQGDAGRLPRLIVDDRAQFDATREAGKLPGYGPADATLGELITDADGVGRAVRERPVGTTVVVNHLGVAVCDLAIGWAVLQAAEAVGAGTELPR